MKALDSSAYYDDYSWRHVTLIYELTIYLMKLHLYDVKMVFGRWTSRWGIKTSIVWVMEMAFGWITKEVNWNMFKHNKTLAQSKYGQNTNLQQWNISHSLWTTQICATHFRYVNNLSFFILTGSESKDQSATNIMSSGIGLKSCVQAINYIQKRINRSSSVCILHAEISNSIPPI